MLAARAPMGWNSWNTFADKINEKLIFEMADAMVSMGYLAAGYEYLVIDDCWSLRDRDENGFLVPNPEKFPHGMKAVSDYVHQKGLKFGMYSCAGQRTCAGYPSSYDHEYQDAATFASWGVDFLKYDFCYFPQSGDAKMRYLTMAMALKASGREILFSACNWGSDESWNWMREVGAHMYRSTGDIFDNFASFSNIAKSQFKNFSMSAPACFNDMDMLTVGMYGKGNVGLGDACTYEDYVTQFALWTFFSAPLMIGGDIRAMDEKCRALMLNKNLLRIDQDEEARSPHMIKDDRGSYMFLKHLSDDEFALGMFNLSEQRIEMELMFADCGVPVASGYGFELTDAVTGEKLGKRRDDLFVSLEKHQSRVLLARLCRV